jgi:hypothetical protein
MRVELNPTVKVVIVFGGKEYECRKPSLGAARDMEASVAKAKAEGGSGSQLIIDHLARCGLPREVAEELDVDQVEAVMEVLTPKKKP